MKVAKNLEQGVLDAQAELKWESMYGKGHTDKEYQAVVDAKSSLKWNQLYGRKQT